LTIFGEELGVNFLLELLEGGDLRSDGHADEVAEDVINSPELFELLWEGLDEDEVVIRGRTAHALEKVSRTRPELFNGLTSQLINHARNDVVPMVRWHMAMLLVNLKITSKETEKVIATLIELLDDESVFVKSWSISSLTILALENRKKQNEILQPLESLQYDKSPAVRNRVSKALGTLKMGEELPQGWSKINRNFDGGLNLEN
jgi:hypothetical protein